MGASCHHEALVSRSVFQKARVAVSARNHEPVNREKDSGDQGRQNHYFLSGKIMCSCCGKPMTHRILHRTAGNLSVWYCRSHLKDASSCPMRWVEEHKIRDAFLRLLPILQAQRTQILHASIDTPARALLEKSLFQIHKVRQAELQAYTGRRISPAEYHHQLAISLRQEQTIIHQQQTQEQRRQQILREELFRPVNEWITSQQYTCLSPPPPGQSFRKDYSAKS